MNAHFQTFPSLCPLQSAYRKFHSTETALLRIYNDLLRASDRRQVTALVLLDLSSAFDTIDHQILLDRLASFYGFSGLALSLLRSYLSDRTHDVVVQSTSSSAFHITTGVPQGSVLGPPLFSLYTSPISHILENTNISFHLYADDTQLYIFFSGSDSSSALASLSHALDSVYSWLTLNRLSVNPNKTEYLLIGTQQQHSKIVDFLLSFYGTALVPVSSARNVGVVFQSDLSFDKNIFNVCHSCFCHIRQIRQIRPSLDLNSSIQLANTLVSSKLDYFNSLFYGLPDTSIKRFKRVQNCLARVIFPVVKRSDHITPTLVKRQWLPIHKRIKFNIATITFKVLKNRQSYYLLALLQPHKLQISLRSSDKFLLETPKIKTALASSSFCHAAPSVWNSLPFDVRNSSSWCKEEGEE